MVYTIYIIITSFTKVAAGDHTASKKLKFFNCLVILFYPSFFGYLLYGNIGLHYAVNGCGEDKIYTEDCPVYIEDFDLYLTRLMWASVVVIFMTAWPAILNFVVYRLLFKASISVAEAEDPDGPEAQLNGSILNT